MTIRRKIETIEMYGKTFKVEVVPLAAMNVWDYVSKLFKESIEAAKKIQEDPTNLDYQSEFDRINDINITEEYKKALAAILNHPSNEGGFDWGWWENTCDTRDIYAFMAKCIAKDSVKTGKKKATT